jgi:hypothetical protein
MSSRIKDMLPDGCVFSAKAVLPSSQNAQRTDGYASRFAPQVALLLRKMRIQLKSNKLNFVNAVPAI